MRVKLYNLYPGQKFVWGGVHYTITDKAGNMVEVETKFHRYAWPIQSTVNYQP